jgi:hypothetical protein
MIALIRNRASSRFLSRTSFRFRAVRAMSTGSDGTVAAGSPDIHAKEPQFAHASRLVTGRALAQDVWSIFNVMNLPKESINMGQGVSCSAFFPSRSHLLEPLGYMNFPPPKFVRDAAEEALSTVQGNHYSHPKGNVCHIDHVRR